MCQLSFRFGSDSSVTVIELRWSEPGCPTLETLIAILSDAGKQQYNLHKSVAEVVEVDIQVLCKAAANEQSTRSNQSK